MVESASQKEIKAICLSLLTRREHSQLELLHKLTRKGFERTQSQLIIAILAEQEWQSNQRFSESYVRYRINKGYGPIKISYELQQRGIENFDLDAVLFDLADGWLEVLGKVYEKKYSDTRNLRKKEWLKRCRFLQQRGFSIEIINTLFRRLNIQIVY